MKAVLISGGFHTRMRPITLNKALPLLEFCNETLLMHQLRTLKEAGISEVLICVHERVLPQSWDAYVTAVAQQLEMKIDCVKEEQALGNAGAFKAAEARIMAEGTDSPFLVVNSDVLCTYPLRDLLHTHMKHGRECTVLTTRCTDTSDLCNYGVVVIDERTGRVRHFVYKPQTFVSDMINAGVYVLNPSIFKRVAPAPAKVWMQDILPLLAKADQLQSCRLSGHWVKLTDTQAFLGAVGPHLEIMRFMKPEGLASAPVDGAYEVRGDVMVHPTAVVGEGSVLGPRVVIGPGCVLGEGVRLEGSTLLEGAQVRSHTLIKDSLVGWRSVVGAWSQVHASVFGEEVELGEGLLVNGATVLPHKELNESIRTKQVVI